MDSDLAAALRKRRSSCEGAKAVVFSPEAKPGGAAPEEEAAPPETPERACSAPAAKGAPLQGRSSPKALQDILRKRREACGNEFESAPDGSTADAGAHEAAAAIEERRAGGLAKSGEAVRKGKRTDDELRKFLEQLRGRCQVLESTPEVGAADAVWNEGMVAEASTSFVLENVPESCVADARNDEEEAKLERKNSRCNSLGDRLDPGSPGSPSSEMPSMHELHRRLVEQDDALTGEERAHVWAKQLRLEAVSSGKAAHLSAASALVVDLICGSCLSPKSGGGVPVSTLAGAFAAQNLHWLVNAREVGPKEADGTSAELFMMLAQVLRYHYPGIAVSIEKDASVPVGAGLAVALEVACGGATGLARMLLVPRGGESESEALRLLCDLVVLEEREALMILIAVELLAEARKVLGKTAFQQLRDRGLAGRGVPGVRQCMEGAVLLHEATPLSLIFALSSGGWATARLQKLLPVCAVAADEVLHHIYERKGGGWRLVVVDVRGKPGDADVSTALPVCLRLDPSQDREAVLRDMPSNESIHLCLMGDGPPGPGEQAMELCSTLATEGRVHLSVAEGGWAAIEGLARTLELELMNMDPEGPQQARGQRGAKAVLSRVLLNFGRSRSSAKR